MDAAGADQVAGELADALAVATRLQGERDILRDSLRTTEGRLEQSGRDGLRPGGTSPSWSWPPYGRSTTA